MIKPTKNRILIKMKEYANKTNSGIILSTSSKEMQEVAKVIEVGEGEAIELSNIKKGDNVIVNKYAGTEIRYEGIEYSLIKIDDVLAIVE